MLEKDIFASVAHAFCFADKRQVKRDKDLTGLKRYPHISEVDMFTLILQRTEKIKIHKTRH